MGPTRTPILALKAAFSKLLTNEPRLTQPKDPPVFLEPGSIEFFNAMSSNRGCGRHHRGLFLSPRGRWHSKAGVTGAERTHTARLDTLGPWLLY